MAGSSLQCLCRTSVKTIGDVVIIDDHQQNRLLSDNIRASNSVWSAMAHRLPAFHRLTAFLEGTP
jgi:hypothetical protein